MFDFEKIRKHIKNWQLENDKDFKVIPTDNHSLLIFNHKNEIVKFIFSNNDKRDECILSIAKELNSNYDMYINQEEGFTYYYFD